MEAENGPAGQRGQLLIGITLLMMVYVGAVTISGLSPVLPAIRDEFAATWGADFLTKSLITVFGVAALIGSPITGWLLKRWGIRNVFMTGVAVFIGSGLLGMVVPNLILLVVTRFAAGFAGAVLSVTYSTFVMEHYAPGKRERWLGYLTMIGAVWAVLGSLMAGELSHFGWRFALLIHLLPLPLLVLIPLAFGANVREDIAPGHLLPKGNTKIMRMVPSIAVGLLSGAVAMSTLVYLPLQINAIGVTDAREIARLIALYMVVTATSALLYGYLRRFFSVSGINMLGFVTAGIGYLSFGLWPLEQWRLLELLVLGFGAGLLTPNLSAFAGRRGDTIEKAKAIGFAKASYFGGAFLFQLVLGALAITAADMSLVALAVVCIPGALVMLAIRSGDEEERPVPAAAE